MAEHAVSDAVHHNLRSVREFAPELLILLVPAACICPIPIATLKVGAGRMKLL